MRIASCRGARTSTFVRGFGVGAIFFVLSSGCAVRGARNNPPPDAARRKDVIARARVWSPTDVSAMNVRRGPDGRRAPAPEALVDCTYVPRDTGGRTPKFLCELRNGDLVMVKHGRDNGEVYAEVAATRLLWALGFGADRVYPVRVRCHGCPDEEGRPATEGGVRRFDVATIELRRPGRPFDDERSGWSWRELDDIEPARGGSSRAQRDALMLLAAMLQHSDSKEQQQRLTCDGAATGREPCRRPFMYIDDLGKTFGTSSALNRDGPSAVNLAAWSGTPMWADDEGCRANLAGSLTGSLQYPVVSDEGRRFLARLLNRLTDRQLRQLFAVARFPLRADAPRAEHVRVVDEWLRAFRAKVAQITERSCAPAPTKVETAASRQPRLPARQVQREAVAH